MQCTWGLLRQWRRHTGPPLRLPPQTVRMTAAQHRESADINFSLMALKDCFRAHAAGRRQASAAAAAAPQPPSLRPNGVPAPVAAKPARDKAPPHIPYRRSRLTQVLRKCFTDPAHRTVVIATVSPAATDLQHTINTANHVCLMAEDLERLAWATTCDVSLSSATFDVPVWKWTPEQVGPCAPPTHAPLAQARSCYVCRGSAA